MIKIIHLSDFHLESDNIPEEKSKLIIALANDLKGVVDENTILTFTGDLLNKGGAEFKDKREAFKKFETIFIDSIIKENPILKNRIFVTPGNHDIVREKIDQISESGLKDVLNTSKSANEFIDGNRDKSKHLDQLSDYKEWENSYYKNFPNAVISNFENSFIVTLKDYKVGVSCFNSSWLCRKNSDDKENLIIGKSQVERSLTHIKDCDIKIAIAHHPLEFLKDFDKENLRIELFRNYQMFLTGHVHELSSSYTQDLFGEIFISIANSTIADNATEIKYVNGYTILEFHPADKIHAIYKKYVQPHNKFLPNTDIGTSDGAKDFAILKNEKLQNFIKLANIVETIETSHAERLNEHLIMSANYTDTVCTIDGVFVEPRILNYPEGAVKEEDSKTYSLDNILTQDKNSLIYGLKESGKTILLDKLFLEAIKRFNHFNKIPILLKFGELKNKDIEKLIKEFAGIPSKDFDNILSNNKIILLIDEIQFQDKHSDQHQNLQNLLTKYPKIQLVCTASQIIESVMPVDYLNFNHNYKFETSFIQSLNSKEIKQLISKWFQGKDVDFADKIEKLIKNFNDFGLPKTPLSVTLFLWIFEKQEKRPINNSVLVELFIENLLEKTKIENIYSETFDFKNKQRLLSFIAKFMNDNGNSELNYCVDYVDLLTFAKGYIETRFSGQPQKIVDDFIRRGILSYEDSNLVRFKSGFFFHYFLGLYMDFDKVFKMKVFSEEHYLNYDEEIIYYTGIKRDDVEILRFTQEKLSEAFLEHNKPILANPLRIDQVLETRKGQTISRLTDDKKIANKMSEEQIEQMYDNQLSATPVQKNIPSKDAEKLSTIKDFDRVLKLASSVLKNSEDVDDFDEKTKAYKNILTSSISFMMKYRDSLIQFVNQHKQKPSNFPENIDFNLFIQILPLIHQIMLYDWFGSQKLRPVVMDKIKKDKLELNISDFEKFISIFVYADIKGADYPEIIEEYASKSEHNYILDLSFLKILSYYHLRSKDAKLDKFYLKLMTDIKMKLGDISKEGKSDFILKIEEKKKQNK